MEALFRSDPSLIGRHAATMHGARNFGYLYQLLAVAGWTSLPWLWSLPQPTLVLMGSDDPLVPPINGHILTALIPNAELQMIDDGHLFIVTKPEETAALIEAFLADASRQVEPSSPLSRMAGWARGLVPTLGGRRDAQAQQGSTERTQFGRPIGGFQLVQDLLVRMLGNVTSTQAMMLRLAQLQDESVMRDEHASLAKAFCTVKCRETVGYARELLGGNGILLENHIGRFVADAEAIYSYESTREMNTLIVGKAITGLSAFV